MNKESQAIASRSSPRSSSRPPARSSGGGFGPFLLGFLVCGALAAGAWVYFHGAVNPFPGKAAPGVTRPIAAQHAVRAPEQEGSSTEQIAAQSGRVEKGEATGKVGPEIHYLKPPFGIGEDVFESGAKTYVARCAACHGAPGREGALAASSNPPALQLWLRRADGRGTGDSALEAGEIYSKTRYGMPHTGMPAFRGRLTDTQIWQLALLLKSADQPLPDPVRALLRAGPGPGSR